MIWFITGSSRGLGRAIAQAALDRGDTVVATARNLRDLDELAANENVLVLPLDVADEKAAEAAIATAVERFGRLDVVVNNAGYADFGSIEEMPSDQFRRIVETNLFGLINVSRAAAGVLRRQGGGHLIQISTVGGRIAPGVGLAAYAAAKHGVEGFSGVLANELGPFGVKVTIIEPGGFRTDWAGSSMSIVPPGSAYAPVFQPYMTLQTGEARPNGDPAKAAAAVLTVADMDEPPLRLPLGSDATLLIRAADEAKIAELDKWRELSESTDADDADMDLSAFVDAQR